MSYIIFILQIYIFLETRVYDSLIKAPVSASSSPSFSFSSLATSPQWPLPLPFSLSFPSLPLLLTASHGSRLLPFLPLSLPHFSLPCFPPWMSLTPAAICGRKKQLKLQKYMKKGEKNRRRRQRKKESGWEKTQIFWLYKPRDSKNTFVRNYL